MISPQTFTLTNSNRRFTGYRVRKNEMERGICERRKAGKGIEREGKKREGEKEKEKRRKGGGENGGDSAYTAGTGRGGVGRETTRRAGPGFDKGSSGGEERRRETEREGDRVADTGRDNWRTRERERIRGSVGTQV